MFGEWNLNQEGKGNDGKNLSASVHDLRVSRTPRYNVSSSCLDRDRSRWTGWLDERLTGLSCGNSLRLNGAFTAGTVSKQKFITDFRNIVWKMDRENHWGLIYFNHELLWRTVAESSWGFL